jgi:hypothetical protein
MKELLKAALTLLCAFGMALTSLNAHAQMTPMFRPHLRVLLASFEPQIIGSITLIQSSGGCISGSCSDTFAGSAGASLATAWSDLNGVTEGGWVGYGATALSGSNSAVCAILGGQNQCGALYNGSSADYCYGGLDRIHEGRGSAHSSSIHAGRIH